MTGRNPWFDPDTRGNGCAAAFWASVFVLAGAAGLVWLAGWLP